MAVLGLLAFLCTVAIPRHVHLDDGTVTCCCGEHDAHEPCGCPTCPAKATGHQRAIGGTGAAFATVSSCAQDRDIALPQIVLAPPQVVYSRPLTPPPRRIARAPDSAVPSSPEYAPDPLPS